MIGNKLSYTRDTDDVDADKKAHPLEPFGNDVRRLASVLDRKLGRSLFVCGDVFTIADIAIYPWLHGWKWSKVDITEKPRGRGMDRSCP